MKRYKILYVRYFSWHSEVREVGAARATNFGTWALGAFQKMTTTTPPQDFAKRLDQTAEDTEALLAKLLDDGVLPDEITRPKRVMDAMRYSSLGGGKRLRPFLGVEISAVFGVAREAALLGGRARDTTP